jgi:hypothetical protein
MAAETARSTWSDERREVWQSVTEAMRSPNLDDERAAACHYLLRHLVGWSPGGSDMMYS